MEASRRGKRDATLSNENGEGGGRGKREEPAGNLVGDVGHGTLVDQHTEDLCVSLLSRGPDRSLPICICMVQVLPCGDQPLCDLCMPPVGSDPQAAAAVVPLHLELGAHVTAEKEVHSLVVPRSCCDVEGGGATIVWLRSRGASIDQCLHGGDAGQIPHGNNCGFAKSCKTHKGRDHRRRTRGEAEVL